MGAVLPHHQSERGASPESQFLARVRRRNTNMPTYKLTYFNITGLGEPLRFLLHYGGADFEDFRIEFEEWPQHKSKMPMEQLPILEIDGKVFHQTRAISRYLAKLFGLYGSNEFECIQVDTSVDDIEDMRLLVTKSFREEDPTYRAKLLANAEEKLPFFLTKFEERVKQNGGYFVNNKITWPDLYFTTVVELLSNILKKDIIADFPTLKKLYDTIRSTPKIKAYLDKRPKTNI